ncbi:hypothetical protein PsYK624_157220 [Phanerochaete sordida]|uniref:Uncharacterized protein n=1 Tax=Phanerochaete sordida TaxID=48140 RepID=A0A9P3GQY9_9APHY|nr:hypothetical protein PsYK624_157220 [Phanerochaete sordida]
MLFAFGRCQGTHYFSNGKHSTWSVPTTLSPHLRERYHVLNTIAFGEHGVWFYKDAVRTDHAGVCKLSTSAAVHYPGVQAVYQSRETINWVAFGPDGKYVLSTDKKMHHTDDGLVRESNSGQPIRLRCASFGYDGAWVVVEHDGTVRSKGLSSIIRTALHKRPVRNAQLSGRSPDSYFIEYVNGKTAWSVPSSWASAIARTEEISPHLNKPGTSGGTTVAKRVLFAFGPGLGQYCISNGTRAHWNKLSDSIEERLCRAGKMQAFSLGEGKSCFWRQEGSTWLSNGTKTAYPEVWRIWASGEKINWVAFGPQGYYIVDTKDKLYASRSEDLLRRTKDGNYRTIRCASFGYGGGWVVVEENGMVRSWNLSNSVLRKLEVGNVRVSGTPH